MPSIGSVSHEIDFGFWVFCENKQVFRMMESMAAREVLTWLRVVQVPGQEAMAPAWQTTTINDFQTVSYYQPFDWRRWHVHHFIRINQKFQHHAGHQNTKGPSMDGGHSCNIILWILHFVNLNHFLRLILKMWMNINKCNERWMINYCFYHFYFWVCSSDGGLETWSRLGLGLGFWGRDSITGL